MADSIKKLTAASVALLTVLMIHEGRSAIALFSDFDGTPVANLGGSNGYGAPISEANLNAGTAVGSWTLNEAFDPPGGHTAKMIQTDGGANVTAKALRFGNALPVDLTSATDAERADSPLLTANLTSNLGLSSLITVSFDYGVVSTDGPDRFVYVTGRDTSNNRLFQLGFNNHFHSMRVGYFSAGGTWTEVGNTGDLSGNNNTFWSSGNMKQVTVEVGPSSYAIQLEGTTLSGASSIAFRDSTANSLERLEFSSSQVWTGGAFDNISVAQVPELSAFAATVGFLALSFAVTRRRL